MGEVIRLAIVVAVVAGRFDGLVRCRIGLVVEGRPGYLADRIAPGVEEHSAGCNHHHNVPYCHSRRAVRCSLFAPHKSEMDQYRRGSGLVLGLGLALRCLVLGR